MSEPVYVLDANTLSDLLRKNETVVSHLTDALRRDALFLLCPVVYFEVYRGLAYKQATRQIAAFLELIEHFHYADLTNPDWERAAVLWAELRRQGRPASDADLLIGAFAIRHSATVVTSNVRDFEPLNVSIENWRI